jgi:hypothetical protein
VPEPASPARHLPNVAPPIIPATDLGGVTVLKRGSVFLLSDPFVEEVPDSRGLGLHVFDTRMLSCLVLLVGGDRPSALRPDPGGPARRTIVLTNSEALAARFPAATRHVS